MSAPAEPVPPRPAFGWLAGLFFVSGAVGLAYEVAWSRGLLLLLGSTASASAIVLAVFVGGLGLGARWGGPRAERHPSPLAFYGMLEIGAALWAVLSLVLLPLLQGPYVAVAAGAPELVRLVLRGVVAALVVLPASFLLGATLPAMVRQAVAQENETGHRTAWLYGLNTVGAVVGCLGTGYFGIALFGVTGVMWIAGGVGVVVGGGALWVARRSPPRAVTATPPRATRRMTPVFGIALLCGLLGLGVEIVGFRVLVYFVEGFTAAFASMLGVFIAGLGLGSLVLGGLFARTDRPQVVLGVVLAVEALLLAVGLYVVVPNLEGWMRTIRAGAYAEATTPAAIAAALRWSSFLGSSLLLFAPAFLLGPTFPLCVRWAEKAGARPGEAVGQTYLGNSIGSLLAPLLVTFGVVPLVGVLGAWIALVALALLAGVHLVLTPVWRRLPRLVPSLAWMAVAALVLASPLLGIPGTDTRALLEASVVLHERPDRSLVGYETDAVTTASVIETRDGERILYTDDFAAAATGRYYRYMRMLGHLPALLAKDPENAMVIAFGTGTTAGAVARHEGVKRLEVVEVSSAVLGLAHHFEAANRGVLDDPRVEVLQDDGRNALLLHAPDLDLITLEPLMPYSPAGLPFYTREFYELARDRLREGGVVCQWIPVHAMPADLYAAFARTFFEVFPDGTLWFFEQSTALIGRKGTAQPDFELIEARAAAIGNDLAEAGFGSPMAFTSGYVASGRHVLAAAPLFGDETRFTDRPVRDADPYPEFEPTPRAGLNTTYLPDTLRWLASLVTPTQPEGRTWWIEALERDTRAQTRAALVARILGAEAAYHRVFAEAASLPIDVRAAHLTRALELADDAALAYEGGAPDDAVLKRRRLQNLRFGATTRARALLQRAQGLPAGQAQEPLKQALRLVRSVLPPVETDPEPTATGLADAATVCAVAQLWLGRCQAASETLRAADQALRADGAAKGMSDLLRAVEAHQAGEPVDQPAWIFRGGRFPPPCREEGLAPVQAEWDAFTAALGAGDHRRLVGAADRLERATLLEDCVPIVRAALVELRRDASPQNAVIVVAIDCGLGRHPALLRNLLEDESAEVRRLALEEVARRKAAGRYPWAVSRDLAEDADPRVRQAFVRAVAAVSEPAYRCAIARLLMDPDVEVRTEAVAALFSHAKALERYDPASRPEVRRPIVAAVLEELGCR